MYEVTVPSGATLEQSGNSHVDAVYNLLARFGFAFKTAGTVSIFETRAEGVYSVAGPDGTQRDVEVRF